jgi:hypothetical protein
MRAPWDSQHEGTSCKRALHFQPQSCLNPLGVKPEPDLLANHDSREHPGAPSPALHLFHLCGIGCGVDFGVTNPCLGKPRFRLFAEQSPRSGINRHGHLRHLTLLLELLIERCTKADVRNRGHHPLNRHLAGVIVHNRLLRRKAHLRTFYTRKPFQGLLDQERSTGSGHPFHVQDDGGFSRPVLFRERNDGKPLRTSLKGELYPVARG